MKTIEELCAPVTDSWHTFNGVDYFPGGRYEIDANDDEDAVASFAICTKTPLRLSSYIVPMYWLDSLEDTMSEMGDPNGCDRLLDFGKEVEADLEESIRAAVDAWQVRHQISILPWTFSKIEKE